MEIITHYNKQDSVVYYSGIFIFKNIFFLIGGFLMGIPLENLLKIGGLRECKVVAGHKGIAKFVSIVTIMEVPDIVKWLKGNELLLTSLYPIKDDPVAQIQLIDKLYKAGTTALAIKTIRFVKEIPSEMIRKANEYGFTLIEIPEHINYLDILSPVMNAIFNKKIVLQEDLEIASRYLNEIYISNGDFNHFIETLSFLTKSSVFLESHVDYVQISEQENCLLPMIPGQLKELEVLKHPIRMVRENKLYNEVSCIIVPIIIDGELYGSITSWNYRQEFMEVDLAILEKAATLLSLEFLRKKVKYDIELQYRSEFIRDLLFNQDMNLQDLIERGQLYGYKEKENYFCMIINENNKMGDDIFSKRVSQIENVVSEIAPNLIVGIIRNSLLLLIPGKELNNLELKKWYERIQVLIEQIVQTKIKIGIGATFEGIPGLRKSFREAEKAITLGSKLWSQKSIILFKQLGVYRLISLLENNSELRQYYNEAMVNLIKYDEENDLELIPTLEEYFKSDESLKETAGLIIYPC